MALYHIEIIETPTHPKALALIGSLANLSQSEAKRRLRRLPMMVQASVPLSDAVSVQRQLSRVGVQARISRADISIEDSAADLAPAPKPAAEMEEIIEIPDADVRILGQPTSPAARMEIRRMRQGKAPSWRLYAILAVSALFLLMIGYFVQNARQARRIESEVTAAIEDWKRTLQDQDAQLDRGISPETIARKLDEIERKLETLWHLLRSKDRAAELQTEFTQAREGSRDEMLNLGFRRSLGKAALPINPTCSIDQGRVRGYCNLPDGARLRIRLFGEAGIESVSYSAQVQDRVFQLIVDPAIEGSVYDARATVAPFTQQPPQVQEWARSVFDLAPSERVSGASSKPIYADRETAKSQAFPRNESQTAAPSDYLSKDYLNRLTAAPDSQISQSISAVLDQWEKTVAAAQENLDAGEGQTLEIIYQRLLNLESRIDEMIELLKSSARRDSCNLRRGEFYGGHRALRQELQQRHQDFLSLRSPYTLESRLQRAFRDADAGQIQVIVFDSPRRSEAFTIEIETGGTADRRAAIWPQIAQIIVQEASKVPLEIDAVRFRDTAGSLLWPLDQIREAAAALDAPDGANRCLELLKSPRPLLDAP